MKLNFYDVDKQYTDYLRNFDDKIPYIGYEDRSKFLCGIVLTVNNMNYYVPVSSNTTKYMSSFLIYDDKRAISSLRFSFMFPCPIECVTLKHIGKESDVKYKNLIQKEYEFINKHVDKIKRHALRIYNLSKKEDLRTKYNLCDFYLLEEKYKEFIKVN